MRGSRIKNRRDMRETNPSHPALLAVVATCAASEAPARASTCIRNVAREVLHRLVAMSRVRARRQGRIR